MVDKFYADVEFLAGWAQHIMETREADFIIERENKVYMRRWWVVPRNYQQNVYLHEILRSDDDRALHDHPWDNTSFLLAGSYTEVMPSGDHIIREPGDVVHRKATDAHRLIIPEGVRAISLFLTGPLIREWGFLCPQGWRSWKVFTELSDDGKTSVIGRGCED